MVLLLRLRRQGFLVKLLIFLIFVFDALGSFFSLVWCRVSSQSGMDDPKNARQAGLVPAKGCMCRHPF